MYISITDIIMDNRKNSQRDEMAQGGKNYVA